MKPKQTWQDALLFKFLDGMVVVGEATLAAVYLAACLVFFVVALAVVHFLWRLT